MTRSSMYRADGMTLLSGSSAKRSMKTWKIGLLAILGGRCGGSAPLATSLSSASSGFSLRVFVSSRSHLPTAENALSFLTSSIAFAKYVSASVSAPSSSFPRSGYLSSLSS